MKRYQKVALATSLALAATASQAAVVVTDVVTDIQGAAAPIAAIGSAVLLVLVGIKVFKWVRRAM